MPKQLALLLLAACLWLNACQPVVITERSATDSAAAATLSAGEQLPANAEASKTPSATASRTSRPATATSQPTGTSTTTSTPFPEGLIQVDTLEQEVYPFVENGKCSLAEAIYAANLAKTVDTCAAGGPEQSIIELMPGTYRLSQIDATPQQVDWAYSTTGTGNALPAIVRTLTIHGHGAVLSRQDAVEPFRILEVLFGTLTLQDITLQGGEVKDEDWGGALLVQNASLVLDGVTVRDSRAENGGGVYLSSGALSVRNSIFSGNEALFSGGGFYAAETKAEFSGSQFIENSADGYGAGLHVQKTFISVTDCIFTGNRSESRGGGINLEEANASILRSQFYRNYANISGAGVSGRNFIYEDDIAEAERDPMETLFEMDTYIQLATQIPGFRETLVAHPSGMYLQRTLDIQVHDSCFFNNTNAGGDRLNEAAAIAGKTSSENNFYGDPSGPSGMGNGTGDSVGGLVIFEPFLDEPPAHCDLSLANE